MEWQPIETAPYDCFVLVYEDGSIRTMMRTDGDWHSPAYAAIIDQYGDRIVGEDAKRITGCRKLQVCDCIYEPTHWMPLPPPPNQSATSPA